MEERPASQQIERPKYMILRKPLPSTNSVETYSFQHDDLPLQNPRRKRKRYCGDWIAQVGWWPELATISLAFAMLVAIVVLLIARQGKPQPRWPSVLGINSLVAIFSSVFKVALLYPITEGISELKWIWFASPQPVSDFDHFDSASRGPWGAFKLLIKHPLNLFISLGAAIMILSLGVDPFTQQTLRFYTCTIPIDGLAATVARANSYARGVDTEPDPRLIGALYQGMLNPPVNATAAISTYCPTGNCTFPHFENVAYSSLAICSDVKDISSSVRGSRSGKPGFDFNWHYSLPSGLEVNYPYGLGCQKAQEGTFGFANGSLFEFEILMMTTNCSNPIKTAGSRQCSIEPLAAQVSLSPCVIEYGNVSVSNSIFQEQIISSMMLPNIEISYLSVGNSSSFPNTDCSGSKTRQGKKTARSAVFTSSSGSTYRCPEPICPGKGSDILWYDPTCIFHFGDSPVLELNSALGNLFNPNGKATYLEVDITSWPQASALVWIAPLWQSGSANISTLSKSMESLTNTLNAVIRLEGQRSDLNVPARGTVLGNQTCVGVEWAWFILPCALLTLAIGFLISIMVQSYRNISKGGAEEGRRPWKSSTLPLLWCGLQGTAKERYGRLNNIEEMKEHGNETEVRLGRGEGDRWELRTEK